MADDFLKLLGRTRRHEPKLVLSGIGLGLPRPLLDKHLIEIATDRVHHEFPKERQEFPPVQRTSRCEVEIVEFGMRADEEFAVCGLLEPADLFSTAACGVNWSGAWKLTSRILFSQMDGWRIVVGFPSSLHGCFAPCRLRIFV